MAKVIVIAAKSVILLSSIIFGLLAMIIGFLASFGGGSSDWLMMLLGLVVVAFAPFVFKKRLFGLTFWGLLILAAMILVKFLTSEGEGEFIEWVEIYAIVMAATGLLCYFAGRKTGTTSGASK